MRNCMPYIDRIVRCERTTRNISFTKTRNKNRYCAIASETPERVKKTKNTHTQKKSVHSPVDMAMVSIYFCFGCVLLDLYYAFAYAFAPESIESTIQSDLLFSRLLFEHAYFLYIVVCLVNRFASYCGYQFWDFDVMLLFTFVASFVTIA